MTEALPVHIKSPKEDEPSSFDIPEKTSASAKPSDSVDMDCISPPPHRSDEAVALMPIEENTTAPFSGEAFFVPRAPFVPRVHAPFVPSTSGPITHDNLDWDTPGTSFEGSVDFQSGQDGESTFLDSPIALQLDESLQLFEPLSQPLH